MTSQPQMLTPEEVILLIYAHERLPSKMPGYPGP